MIMRKKLSNYLLYILILSVVLTSSLTGCATKQDDARALLDKYFTSAMNEDYETTYTCYYNEYQKKIPKDEFVLNRKDASVVQSYKILQLDLQDDTGMAIIEITFAPSPKLNRSEPVTVKVQEDLVKEENSWKIKVW